MWVMLIKVKDTFRNRLQEERQVKQFQMTNWSDDDDTPGSCDTLLHILQLTRVWAFDHKNTPIVVHCRYIGP